MDDGSIGPILTPVIIILLLLFGAMYFAVCETGFSSVSRIRVKAAADKGDRQARRAAYVLDNFDRAITTMLIGTNIIHIVLAAYVTVIVTRVWGLPAVALGTVATTIVVFFLGEMLPKSVGKKYSERFALGTAASLCFFMRVFAPVSAVLTAIGRAVSKLTRGDAEISVTEDELYDIIENMTDGGELPAEQGDLVQSALMFADVTVENVLTARIDVAAVDVAWPPERILAVVKAQRHSRLPVYRDSIDNIIGILQIRKYIKAWIREGAGMDILSLLDEAFFVHMSTNIDDLLPEMSRKRLNMAVVTDNFGGTLGIVTIEDILEELVGEIWDEEDVVVESFIPLGGGRYELDAELSVGEAFELLDYDDPEEDDSLPHKLMGEWAYEQFDLIPSERDSFTYHDLQITISKMDQHRIRKLEAKLLPPAAPEGGERR